MNQDIIEITMLEDFPSVLEGIFYFSPISKAQLKKMKMNKNYLSKPLLKGDVLSLPIDVVNYMKINPYYRGAIQILFEDTQLIAISKPVNIHSHPLSYTETDNILSGLYQLGRDKDLVINRHQYDRGLMYRLDYATSGLLIYLRDEKLYFDCREHFHEWVIKKSYMAVVAGKIDDRVYQHELVSSGLKGAKIVEGFTGKSDKSEISTKLIEYNKERDLSLIYVSLGQGKRHQIRAQLSIVGHAILGDSLYGKASDRLYLHCFEYQFKLNEKEYTLQDKNTADLTKFFNFNS